MHMGILSAFAGCVPRPSPRSGDSRDSGSPSCPKRSFEVHSGRQGWGGSRHNSHSHCGGPAPSSTEYPGNPSLFVLCGCQRPPPSSLPCACQAPHPPVVGLGLTSSLLFCPYLPTPTPKGGAQTLSQNSRTPLTLCHRLAKGSKGRKKEAGERWPYWVATVQALASLSLGCWQHGLWCGPVSAH